MFPITSALRQQGVTPEQLASLLEASSMDGPSVTQLVGNAVLHDNAVMQQNNNIKVSYTVIQNVESDVVFPQPDNNFLSENDAASMLSKYIDILKAAAKTEREKDPYVMQGLSLYVPLNGASSANAEIAPPIEEQVCDDFLIPANPAKVLLLQGNSGAGKSLFGRYLEKKLWENYTEGQYIPLFISLPLFQSQYPQGLKGKLLESHLQTKEIPKSLLSHIKKTQMPLFMILDGYDETGLKTNLFQDNHLLEWNVKVLITCRTQYLTGDYSGQFEQVSATHQPIPGSLIKRYLVPFDETKLKEYIRNFASNPAYNKAGLSENVYTEQLMTIYNWQELAKEPFVLSTLLTILPGLTKKGQLVTRYTIYGEFINQWFNKEFLRLGGDYQAYIQSQKLTKLDVLDIFHEFAEDLAFKMLETGEQVAVRPAERSRRKINRVQGVWDELFIGESEEKQQELRIGLEGSPLKHRGESHYLFIHKSFYEYFVAELLVEDLLEKKGAAQYHRLNKKLLTHEPAIFQFMVDKMHSDNGKYSESLKQHLFAIVHATKTNKQLGTAAANAITILNHARISFSARDFSKVKIAGADLSRAILDHTTFYDANIKHRFKSEVQFWEGGLSVVR